MVVITDGGRAAAGFKGIVGDCVCRSIAIATELPYRQVYDDLNKLKKVTEKRWKGAKSSSREGVFRQTYEKYLFDLGWSWVPLMGFGTGCRFHLRKEELPSGRLICSISGHMVAVIDGIVHDTYDCSREGHRCVYGYYYKKEQLIDFQI